MTDLTPDEGLYYSRQMIVPNWGKDAQSKLKRSRVLVVGAGGLGAPVLMYLAGAGVGQIGVLDGDFIEMSNLHRQVIHSTLDIDQPKVASASAKMRLSNPHIEVMEHLLSLSEKNAAALIAQYDYVADCTDNFNTRMVLAEACAAARVPLISGAAQISSGMLTTFTPYRGDGHPCFRCLYPVDLGSNLTPSCSQIGIVGPVLSVIGGLQAMEVIKEILEIGTGLSGRIIIYEALDGGTHEIALDKRDTCAGCQAAASAGAEDALHISDQPPVMGG